ncbi:hypothetical protein EOD42_07515 [Rhodovarius crocodyli]|uniref:Uncharacterized protein n=1 Tax=Rhodovarius crocodyli TaxID=1979269 RepID=A0A437MJ60_9PROT|nr:hypothetical protein [Rhodovarius crocodyli]RVT97656.1 hypothetical protein EOD42_07515 [Rhodovarius crocodyli]
MDETELNDPPQEINTLLADALYGAEVAATAALLRNEPPQAVRDAAAMGAGQHLMGEVQDIDIRRAVALGLAREAVDRVAHRVGVPL